MKPRELVELALDEQILSDKLHGKTPFKTMQARLSVDIVKRGSESEFIRTSPGTFYLRAFIGENVAPDGSKPLLSASNTDGALVAPYSAPRRAPAKPDEMVLVTPATVVARHFAFQGIRAVPAKTMRRLIASGQCRYVNRLVAEESEEYKQIITYVLVRRDRQVLCFRRGEFNRAASFLRGSLCIGFGGHVTETDLSIFSYKDMGISSSALREIEEEISVPASRIVQRLRLIGVINDDSSSVGRKHLGIVYECSLPPDINPTKGEASINQLRWIDLKRDRIDLNDFEYWSQLCWRAYFPRLARGQPAFRVVRRGVFTRSHVVAIIGAIGSGKSETTKYLCKDHGYAEVNSGRVLAKLLAAPPVPRTRRNNFQKKALQFIKSPDGPLKLATAISAVIQKIKKDKIVVDGIRHRATLDALRVLVRPARIAVVFVHAAPDVALNFIRRREAIRSTTTKSLLEIYSAPVEHEVRQIISDADAVIYNWVGKQNYRKVVSDLMRAVHRK